MNWSRTTVVLLAAMLSAATAQAQGDIAAKTQPLAAQIVCPVAELKWGIAQSFPDPWWSPSYTVPHEYGPVTFWQPVNGKEALYCRYRSVRWVRPPEWPDFAEWDMTASMRKVFVIRPHNASIPQANWPCPPTVEVKSLSLPAPWLGTQYVWQLTKKWTHVGSNLAPGTKFDICEYAASSGDPEHEPNKILYTLQTVAQAGMTGLASNPPPPLTPMDQLKQVFLVTKAQLTAIPAKRSTSCPTTVRFEGRIAANGPGTVSYRREINGQTGPVQTLTFTALGEKVVKFDTQVQPSQQQAGLSLAAQPQPSNVVNGQARIVIESPSGVSESNLAKYEITCTPLAPAGNLAQTPLPPEPTQPTLAAPTPSTDPTPAAMAAAPQQARARPARVSQPEAAAPAPATIAAAALALPDLRISAAELHKARPTILRVQVVNSGLAGSAATRVRVWTPDGKSWHAPVPALASGQEVWVVVRADVPLTDARDVRARVDDPDRVKESDETNNEHAVK